MILYGDKIKVELKNEILNSKNYKKVHFYLYSNKDDVPSFYYLKGIKRTLDELEIPYDEDFLDLNKSEKENIDIFKKNSKDKMIVLARPLPSDYENKLIPLIDHNFDPDMMSDINKGKLYSGDLRYLPATAQSVLSFIKYYKIDIEDKKVTIVGRSLTVGLPVFMLIQKLNGLAVLVHSKINEFALQKEARNSDIIILASGKSGLIKRSTFSSFQTLIDCGFSGSGCDLGFVPNENEFKDYTPVPKGIGSLTSYELVINALTLLDNNTEIK